MTLVEGLQRDLTTEHASLVAYLTDSSPWVRQHEAEAFERFKALREVELEHVNAISDALEALGAVPSPGVFELWRHDLNYLAFDYLVGFTIEHHEEKLTRYAARAEAAEAEWPDIAALYRRMIDDEREKLATLREIAGT